MTLDRLLRTATCLSAGLLFALTNSAVPAQDRATPEKATPEKATDAKPDEAAIEFFEKQVRPVLVNRCYECHSRDAKKIQGNFRVDSRAAILKGGDTGPAAIPGKPKESLLVDSINYGDTYQMPPKSKMPDAEIAALTKWVEMGLPWPPEKDSPPTPPATQPSFEIQTRKAEHWCWRPIADPALPSVRQADWPRQDLDRFILARLEGQQLAPSAAADKRTLIRRAYFDLIGLPPSREEIAKFLADDSPRAFERVVDELLQSPHFGERWARHWMDLVRYAETYGHEFDFGIPHAARYRDYLIRAYNADVPYDQFVLEHLAGDLLPEPRRHPTEGFNESIIGTGFWFLGEATHAPVDVLGDEQGRIDNQLDVMSKTFLGLTIACARCHDHKFDAISTRDFYALSGIVKSSRRQEALLDPQGKISAAVEQLGAARSRGDDALRAVVAQPWDAVEADVAKYLLAARDARRPGAPAAADLAAQRGLDPAHLDRWLKALDDPAVRQPVHPLNAWSRLADPNREPTEQDFKNERDRLATNHRQTSAAREKSVLFADFSGSDYGGWMTTGDAFERQPTQPAGWDARSKSAQLVTPGVASSGALTHKTQGALRSPTFTITHPRILYRLRGRDMQIRLIIDGYFMDSFTGLLFAGCTERLDKRDDWTWHVQGGDIGRYLGHRAHIEILDNGDGFAEIDEIRFSNEGPTPDPAHPLNLAALETAKDPTLSSLAAAYGRLVESARRSCQDRQLDAPSTDLVNWLLRHQLFPADALREKLDVTLADIGRAMDEIGGKMPAPMRVLAMTDGNSLNDRVHIRGNHRTLGEPVPRRGLEALDAAPIPDAEPGSGRLRFARELVTPTNPLVSRVMVNRVWHHLFGRGIVGSVDNFGVLGQTPTHPELLDHLSTRFMRDGWSVKRLIRSIMLSATYQMSSHPDGPGDAADPQNLLLHRQRLRRLEGEAIRDAILKISGRLDPTVYGGSVPVHLTPFMQGRGRPGGSGPLDGAGRRSLYGEVRRNFLPPMMLAFDTPIPFSSVGARNTSNVPAQALILMNDPFVVEQAKLWAARSLKTPNQTPPERIATLYEDAFARPPSETETREALEFLATQAREYGLPGDAPVTDLRPWTDLCHVLWNVKEFVVVH